MSVIPAGTEIKHRWQQKMKDNDDHKTGALADIAVALTDAIIDHNDKYIRQQIQLPWQLWLGQSRQGWQFKVITLTITMTFMTRRRHCNDTQDKDDAGNDEYDGNYHKTAVPAAIAMALTTRMT